jgi:L-threonylcarbamoyladenylate synthase
MTDPDLDQPGAHTAGESSSGHVRTLVLRAADPTADRAAIERAAALLRAGELVAFPTETVYGLGADATRPEAAARVFAAKERPLNDPLIVHLAHARDLPSVARLDSALAAVVRILSARFWPGPLTLVLPRGDAIAPVVTAGGDTVGVRVPAHPVACALIDAAGVPVAAPSANRFMHTSPTSATHVLADLNGRIACILDGGPSSVGVESTVLDMTTKPPRLLRPGAVTLEALRAVLGIVDPPADAAPEPNAGHATSATAPDQPPDDRSLKRAPGQFERHYAPRASLEVWDGDGPAAQSALLERARSAIAAGERVGALVPDDEAQALRESGAHVFALGPAGDLAAIARHLYAGLRDLDEQAVDRIVAHTFGQTGLGLAVRDRLRRAAGGRFVTEPHR